MVVVVKLVLGRASDEEGATVEAAALEFREKIASNGETKRGVVDNSRKYNADTIKAGRRYRNG